MKETQGLTFHKLGTPMTDTDRRSVFVLDIDELFLIAIEHRLENAGFATTTTWNPAEGIRLLQAGHFDFLLLGDHPPELDAAVFLAELPRKSRPTHCLVLHTLAAPPPLNRFISLGPVAIMGRWDHEGILEFLRTHEPCSHARASYSRQTHN